MILVIILALAAFAVAAWQLGLFERRPAEGMRTVHKASVTDESGGELIVTKPDAPHVEDLELPETPMTPVPPGEDRIPTPAAPTETE
jgi:hypothetical protein